MTELPTGWGVLELAEQRASDALAAWDKQSSPSPRHAVALAEATRKLLAELDAERRVRAGR